MTVQKLILIPPIPYDGFLLAEHLTVEIGHNFHKRMYVESNNLCVTINDLPQEDIDAIQPATDTYIHPVDVAAARNLSDVALAR